MKKFVKTICTFCIALMLTTMVTSPTYNHENLCIVYAHPGRLDSSGGHHDNKNKSGLGGYHYHCGGNSAHLHKNGVCPYESNNTSTNSSSKKAKIKGSNSSKVIKKVQLKLNKLGYKCGTPDGKFGSQTKKALKNFQKDNGLSVDGILGKQVKKALHI